MNFLADNFYSESLVLFQWILLIILVFAICSSIALVADSYNIFIRYKWSSFLGYFKFILIGLLILISLLNIFLLYSYHYTYTYKLTTIFTPGLELEEIQLYLVFQSFYFSLNETALVFILLVSLLYPLILILMNYDFGSRQYRYFSYMIWLYLVVYLFILAADLLIFYIVYEFMVGLVFYVMYLTANSRGGIEAILFFMGWAVIGSFLVGIAVIYILINVQSTSFAAITSFTFTDDECYFLYFLFFFGFGTKLSIWPFWYWLPRAHVEVSTGMSVFLSCILVKVCFYGLIRACMLIGGEIIILPFIFFCGLCIFDLTLRLVIQTDLKAITAYGSVLHVNLLIILFLLDTNLLNNGLIFYIWGHSYATAGIFYAINLIERSYGTRSTFEISGAFSANPLAALVAIFALITFLEFPLSFFFWGEFWLWLVAVEIMPLTTVVIMLLSVVIYIIIFFRLWWGVLFGAASRMAKYPRIGISWSDLFIAIYIIIIQYIIGLQPNLLCWFTIS